jgi:hypothetical protein
VPRNNNFPKMLGDYLIILNILVVVVMTKGNIYK